jgi:hypothetical protein
MGGVWREERKEVPLMSDPQEIFNAQKHAEEQRRQQIKEEQARAQEKKDKADAQTEEALRQKEYEARYGKG